MVDKGVGFWGTITTVISAAAVNTQDEQISLDAVTKNGSLKITFSEAVKSSTVNNTTFKITDASGKNISLPASDVKLNPGGKTATVDLKNVGLDKKATYTLTVTGVQSGKGTEVESYKTAFTIANVAVIQAIQLDNGSPNDELDTNMNTDLTNNAVDNIFGANNIGKNILVKYDELLDATTVNAANIALTNNTTGERIPVNYATVLGSGSIVITTDAKLVSKVLYTLTISNVKTAVNGEAESMTHIFTVDGVEPLSGNVEYKTLDSKPITGNNVTVWPKLTAGLKEKINNNDIDSDYFAGLQINVTVQENLDEESVKNNVILVEKETKELVDISVTYNSIAKMISIVPKADLKEDFEYEIQYLGGLKTTENVYLKANKKTEAVAGKEVSFKTKDATAPEVIEIVAKSGTTGFEVSKEQEFIVKFSEPITLTANRVIIAESSVDIEKTAIGVLNSNNYTVNEIAGTDSKEWSVKINENALTPDKAYKLRITGKDAKDYASTGGVANIVSDGASNFLQKTAVYTFSTELDTTAPKLVNVYEKDDIFDASKILTATKTNVENGDKFTFLFDEEVIADSSQIAVEKNVNGKWESQQDITFSVAMKQNKDGKNVAIVVTLNQGSASDAKYRLVFKKGAIKDSVPGDNANVTDEFKYEFVATAGNDKAADVTILSGINANGSDVSNVVSNISDESRFFIGLAESKTVDITSANVTVKDAAGNVVAGELKKVTDSTTTQNLSNYLNGNNGTVYVFVPSQRLTLDTTYTVVVDGVKDTVGNVIEKKAISFKTTKGAAKITSVTTEAGELDKETTVNRTPKITIKFNQKVENATITLSNLTANTDYNLSSNADQNEYTITFKNEQELDANTKYTLTINPDTTVGSNPEQKEINFTTGLDKKDVVKPELSTIDVDGRTIKKDVSNELKLSSGTITLTFDEKLNKDDVKVEINNLSDSTKSIAVASKDLSNDGKVLTLTTAGIDTTDGTTYKVIISGIKDEAKNEADAISFILKNNINVTNAAQNSADEANKAIAKVSANYKNEVVGTHNEDVTFETSDSVTVSLTKLADLGNICTINSSTVTVTGEGTAYYKAEFSKASGTTVTKYYKVEAESAGNCTISETTETIANDNKAVVDEILNYEGSSNGITKSGVGTGTAFTYSKADNTIVLEASTKSDEDTSAVIDNVQDAGLSTKVGGTSGKTGYYKVTFKKGSVTETRYYKVTVAASAVANNFTVATATAAEAGEF